MAAVGSRHGGIKELADAGHAMRYYLVLTSAGSSGWLDLECTRVHSVNKKMSTVINCRIVVFQSPLAFDAKSSI
jgi:hypothetical protein